LYCINAATGWTTHLQHNDDDNNNNNNNNNKNTVKTSSDSCGRSLGRLVPSYIALI
jgi:hypothetical protein